MVSDLGALWEALYKANLVNANIKAESIIAIGMTK